MGIVTKNVCRYDNNQTVERDNKYWQEQLWVFEFWLLLNRQQTKLCFILFPIKTAFWLAEKQLVSIGPKLNPISFFVFLFSLIYIFRLFYFITT